MLNDLVLNGELEHRVQKRAYAIRSTSEGVPVEAAAETGFDLARMIVGRDRERARGMVEKSLAVFEASERIEAVEEARAWLAAN